MYNVHKYNSAVKFFCDLYILELIFDLKSVFIRGIVLYVNYHFFFQGIDHIMEGLDVC